jgi:hypothetical protein
LAFRDAGITGGAITAAKEIGDANTPKGNTNGAPTESQNPTGLSTLRQNK